MTVPSSRELGPTIVVGAGPHALTITVRLLTEGLARLEDLLVLDPAGGWLDAWRANFRALGIEHLRSPVVHHPHPDPYALLGFTREHRRGSELHGRYQSPGTALFDDFCDAVIGEYELDDAVTAGTITDIDPDGTVAWTDTSRTSRTSRAGRIVIASNPLAPVVPTELRRRSSDHDLAGRHPHPDAVHAAQVDPALVRPDEHVVILGGGLTAGHLACSAVARGGRVTLLTRRPLVEREFDTDPGWLGPRHMQRYLATDCLTSRARLAAEARGGGSMPGWMLARLTAAERAGSLSHRVQPTAASSEPRTTEAVVGAVVEAVVELDADHLWCATGWTLATTCDPVLGPLVGATACDTVGELLVLGPRLELPRTAVPVHVVGRPATLQLGPTAGNLAGARRAADLISGHEPDAIA